MTIKAISEPISKLQDIESIAQTTLHCYEDLEMYRRMTFKRFPSIIYSGFEFIFGGIICFLQNKVGTCEILLIKMIR